MNFILFPGKRQPTGTRSEQEKRRPHSQATSSAEVPPPHARRIVPVVPSSSACAVPRSAHCGAPKSPSRACLGPLPQLSATFFYIPSSSAPPCVCNYCFQKVGAQKGWRRISRPQGLLRGSPLWWYDDLNGELIAVAASSPVPTLFSFRARKLEGWGLPWRRMQTTRRSLSTLRRYSDLFLPVSSPTARSVPGEGGRQWQEKLLSPVGQISCL